MFQLFIPVYQQLCQVYKDLDDEKDMISPLQVGSMFVDWTDPQKAVYVSSYLGFPAVWFILFFKGKSMGNRNPRVFIWI